MILKERGNTRRERRHSEREATLGERGDTRRRRRHSEEEATVEDCGEDRSYAAARTMQQVMNSVM